MAMTTTEENKQAETNFSAELARLRAQVEELMHGTVGPAVTEARERVEKAAHVASDAVKSQADALSGEVRQHPLLTLAVAIGVGFLVGRATR